MDDLPEIRTISQGNLNGNYESVSIKSCDRSETIVYWTIFLHKKKLLHVHY